MCSKVSRKDLITAFQNYNDIKEQIKDYCDDNQLVFETPEINRNKIYFKISFPDLEKQLFIHFPKKGKDENLGFFTKYNGSLISPSKVCSKDKAPNKHFKLINKQIQVTVNQKKPKQAFEWKDIGTLDSIKSLIARIEMKTDIASLTNVATNEAFAKGKARKGQSACRKLALATWNGKCVVTGCDVKESLEAAHIIPWKTGEKRGIKENLLLMRGDIHSLFDRGKLKIDPKTFEVSIHVGSSSYYNEYDNISIQTDDLKDFNIGNFQAFLEKASKESD